ncbi:ATP synthase subunit C domain-containing protein [Rhizoctonia solani AG-1 IA]|uniref:V-type proton ATPase proteolipid subunit n=1 Tax=Thanatephorus cucumeris (strain AG1-IA) TaxID=983506 RepID=L8WGJ1_THACA|nr:ATP synthase subunit C domain-containing protein [Rhizoctonia solani AG-1 IA]
MSTDYCPVYSPFFSALYLILLNRHWRQSSLGISAASVMRPDLMVRSCIPVVMAGIIAVQHKDLRSSCISVHPKMPLFTSVIQLGAGLSVGLSGLAVGFAIGIAGDAGVRGTVVQPRLFVGMTWMLCARASGKLRAEWYSHEY